MDLARLGNEIAEDVQVALLLSSMLDSFYGLNSIAEATGKDVIMSSILLAPSSSIVKLDFPDLTNVLDSTRP